LGKEEKKITIPKINWKNSEYAKEFTQVQITNPDFLKLYNEASSYIVGMDNLLKSIMISLLADGHILVE
jgi:hypothetical protein